MIGVILPCYREFEGRNCTKNLLEDDTLFRIGSGRKTLYASAAFYQATKKGCKNPLLLW